MDYLTKENIESISIINPTNFENKINEHFEGKRNWQNLIWNFLMFQSWYNEI